MTYISKERKEFKFKVIRECVERKKYQIKLNVAIFPFELISAAAFNCFVFNYKIIKNIKNIK